MPLNAAGVVILAYVAVLGREFDPWLRLIGVAALAQHAVAHFYAAIPRFYYLSWLLTAGCGCRSIADIPISVNALPALPYRKSWFPALSRLQKASS